MKKYKSLSILILLISFLLFPHRSLAQGDVSELVKSGPGDATKLAKAFFDPGFKGLGFGMNSAWFNSAKSKNLGKFDIKFQATAAFVPSDDQRFDINSIGLSNKTRLRNANDNFTPTAFGDNHDGSELVLYDDNNTEVGSFKMPRSTGIKFVPSPQVQLTVGLLKNTDASLRYSPKIDVGGYGDVQVLGFGFKHEITSLILPGKTEKIIPIDIAVAFGYNRATYNYKFAVADQVDDQNSGRDLGQRIRGEFSGYTFDAIVSKKLAIFTPFVSVGYNTAQSKLNLLGDYVVRTGYNVTPPLATYTTFTDPVKIKQTDISGLRANVGFSLHLAFFRLYSAYSVGEYTAFTGGFGFGIGK